MATIASSLPMEIAEVFLYLYHLSVLILLIAKRKTMFKGAFYQIFRIVLVADLIYYILVSFGGFKTLKADAKEFGLIWRLQILVFPGGGG